jgi:hypothetical protein
VSFAAITLCVASQRVLIVVSVYFVIDSVRKLLDTLSYASFQTFLNDVNIINGSELKIIHRKFTFVPPGLKLSVRT